MFDYPHHYRTGKSRNRYAWVESFNRYANLKAGKTQSSAAFSLRSSKSTVFALSSSKGRDNAPFNPYSNKSSKSRKKLGITLTALIFTLIGIILIIFFPKSFFVGAGGTGDYYPTNTAGELLDMMDSHALNQLLAGLGDKALSIFGGTDFITILRDIVTGNLALDYSNVFSYVFSLFGTSIEGVLWLLITIVAVSILYSTIGGLKSNFSETSVSRTIHIASMVSVFAVVATTTYAMLDVSRNLIETMTTQISVIFPIILSVMTAIGASTSAAVYQPTMAVISGAVMQLIIAVLIPMVIFAFVFITVGSVSGQLKLTKMSDFILSAVKWMLGMAFFLVCAFMSVQGITASVFDSVSIRTTKLTLSRYLPVIGNYMSEGLNLIISGGVVVKNALGYTGIILLVLSILPIIIQLIVYSLVLKLAAAITEPLGNEVMSKYLSKVSELVGVMTAILLGAALLYFIFILLIVMTGNISI